MSIVLQQTSFLGHRLTDTLPSGTLLGCKSRKKVKAKIHTLTIKHFGPETGHITSSHTHRLEVDI